MDKVLSWLGNSVNLESIFVNTMGSLLAAIILIIITAPWKWFSKPKQIGLNGKVSVEYWRLFGGRSVPILMKLFDRTHEVVPDETYNPQYEHVKYLDGDPEDSGNLIDHKHYRFYLSLIKKRNIKVSRRLLWEKYAGNLSLGTWKDFLSKRPANKEIYQLIWDNDLDAGFCIDDYPKNVGWKKSQSKISDLTGQVGYLFFKIKNISNEPLAGAKIIFEKAHVENVLPKEDWVRSGGSFEALRQKIISKGPLDKILVGPELNFAEEVEFDLGTLESGTEVLFLLHVYRSNKKGYEEFYLDDVFKPKTISHQNTEMKIREPLRDASIRELVPDGWFHQ